MYSLRLSLTLLTASKKFYFVYQNKEITSNFAALTKNQSYIDLCISFHLKLIII